MKSPAIEELISDPSKLNLMNLGGWSATSQNELRWKGEKKPPLKLVSTNIQV